ncbi:MAG: sodium ion-translocating decarboxylase subunit beta [Candidatus Caccosoma sp.]|nr:sodium ion-translocating decarboxylase subunit beta [Candidatus Caccosoma sp.]
MGKFVDIIKSFLESTGFVSWFTGNGWMNLIMILVGLVFLYLALKKNFEPYLLIPIAFGIILVNLYPGIYATYNEHGEMVSRGLLGYLHLGVECELYPCLIFLGIGATTDFGPLIANKKTMLLGAAAQLGIFGAFLGALALGFNAFEASSIGIIGGADGPTAILVSSRMLGIWEKIAPTVGGTYVNYQPAIALAAYSYMALVPIIFPPIIRLFTTKKERLIKMEQLREVSKKEKILFPIIVTLIVCLIVPAATPLIGCLMLGNLIKESGVVPNLVNTIANSLLYICTILLGLSVGATAIGSTFLTAQTLYIFALGICAFIISAIGGLLGGKLMCVLTHGKVNPMIGAAGVSAVPMAARVVQKEGQREDPSNFLLMHAMGPNVAGVIGSAVAAGILISLFL